MDFSDWYRELENETEDELWCISLNCTRDFSTSVSEWTWFLRRVAEIRSRMTKGNEPRTTYAWHDEQECQLRFATANCDPNELPFGCKFDLQRSPDSIVTSWLNATDCIPSDQLEETDQGECEGLCDIPPLRVWAIQIKEA